jgi:Uma2 family endonuclease
MSTTKARTPRPRRLLEGFPPDTRIVVMGVTWEDYDRFSRAVREGENCRVAFDGKDIELMVLGPFHESLRGIIDAFIAIVARELGVEHQAVGSTTWKRKKVKRGIESDVYGHGSRTLGLPGRIAAGACVGTAVARMGSA